MNKSNDTIDLTPNTEIHGPSLYFDFPSLKIGIAEYEEGPTGCTVFSFSNEVRAAIDIRGGSPSTFTTDNPNFTAGERVLEAICFTGGSVHGLEAVTGVTTELLKMKGYTTAWMPKVAGATIYDFVQRENAIYPDKSLGRAAMQSAKTGIFPIGPQGAGRSAKVGKGFHNCESSGQGGAFLQIGSTKILVFTVVNSMGAIIDRDGKVIRGYLDQVNHIRHPIQDMLTGIYDTTAGSREAGNTTLTLVITNQILPANYLRHLAKQIHTSMARAIYPFHTIDDGDVLFMTTTNEVDNPDVNANLIGLLASELAWDAVLSSVQ